MNKDIPKCILNNAKKFLGDGYLIATWKGSDGKFRHVWLKELR